MDAYGLVGSATETKNQDLVKMVDMFIFTFRLRTGREPWPLASLWTRENILEFWGNPCSSENSETAVE